MYHSALERAVEKMGLMDRTSAPGLGRRLGYREARERCPLSGWVCGEPDARAAHGTQARGDRAARPGRRAGWTAAGPGPGLPRRVCSGLGLATGTAFRAATFLWGEERGLSPGDPLGRQLGTVCLRPGSLHVEVVNKR